MRFNKYFIVAIILLSSSLATAQKRNKAGMDKGFITISVEFKEAQPSDTLFLAIDNILYKNSDKNNLGWYSATGKNKWFRFVVPVSNNSGYWDIYKKRTFTNTGAASNNFMMIQDCYWEKGDNIRIHLSNEERQVGIYSSYSFEGRGSAKYNARRLSDSAYLATQLPYPGTFQIFDEDLNFHQYDQKAVDNGLRVLHSFKKMMSELSYEVLKADIIYKGNTGYNFPSRISKYYQRYVAGSPDSVKSKFRRNYKKRFATPDAAGISMASLSHSRNYLFFLCNRFRYESYFLNDSYNTNWIIGNIINNTNGIIRDQVLAATFLSIQKFDDAGQLYIRARSLMTDPNCLAVMSRLQAAAPGKPFMDFNLPDVNGKRVRLSDFKGKIVLIDFWFNGCPGCSVFYKNTLSRIEADFSGSDKVVFVSICGDIGRKRWLDGINLAIYTSSGAINLYTDGKGFKHPVVTDNIGGGFPFVVLIDKAGIIRYLNSPNLYDYKGLAEAIGTL